MALSKLTDIRKSLSVEVEDLKVNGITTFTGSVSIGGTLTYQDVTNVDSIGIITARSGINVSGGQLDVGNNIKIGNAGVITATSFSGDGSNLTGISAGTSLSGSTNNTVCTVTGANAIQGEANLQFDGTNIGVGVAPSGVASYSTIHLKGQTSGNGGAVRLTDYGDTPDSDDFTIYKNSAAGYLRINGTDPLIAYLNGAERVRITSAGKVLIGTSTPQGNANADDLVISTSGHSGITIRSGTSSNGNIFFADGTSGGDEYRGVIDYNHSSNHMSFSTNAVERVRIKSDGKMGVNTNNPQEMLHVNGTTQSTDYKYTSHPGHAVFTGDNSTTSFTIQSGHSVNSILVVYNGAVLTPTTDYTVSGTTLSMNGFTPPTNAHICVRYLVK